MPFTCAWPPELALGADLARDARHLGGERRELIDHRVDGVLELEDLALDVDGDLLRQVAVGDRRRHLGDVAHLAGEVRGHVIDAVGEVLPGARDALDGRLAAQLALGADLARDARHLGGERRELVHHRVDGVLELEDLALDVDGDLPRQVALGDRRGHVGDVAHLAGQVRGQEVDVVGQVLPDARDAAHVGLSAELALAADLAGDARHLAGKGRQLIDHRVDGVLELEDLALDVDGDLLRQVAGRDRGGHLGDVAHLPGQVRRHEVDVVGEVLPRARDAGHVGLAAQLALGADLAGDARHLGGERRELVHHHVDGVLELEDLALDVDGDLLRQVAVGDRRRHLGDVAHLAGQVRGHEVDVVGEVLPDARDALHHRLAAQLALGADLAGHAGDLGGERRELIDHGVDGVLELEDLALDVDGDLARQVAVGDRGGHVGDVSHLAGQVRGHEVDVVGEVLPDARHALHVGLAAQLALGADLAGDARHLRRERRELIDHGVEGVLEVEHLALDVDGDLLRQIAPGHRLGDLGDVAHLAGEVRGHQVDVVGQILPGPRDPLHHRLPAQLALGADLARDAGDLGGERRELIDHGVDHLGRPQELAAQRPPVDLELHALAQIALGHRADDARHLRGGLHQVGDQRVHRVDRRLPAAGGVAELGALVDLAFLADDDVDPVQLAGEPVVEVDDVVQDVGDLAGHARLVDRQAHGEVALAHRQQRRKHQPGVQAVDVLVAAGDVLVDAAVAVLLRHEGECSLSTWERCSRSTGLTR
jgi:hypothetical protein